MKTTILMTAFTLSFAFLALPVCAEEDEYAGFSAKNLSFAEPSCSKIPTLEEVKVAELTNTSQHLSAKAAASVGIKTVHAEGNRDHLVIVNDYQRSKRCESIDGKFDLDYGQQIRTVIELLEYKADVATSLPILAAKGTLENKTQLFYLYKNGMYNPKIDELIASTSGKSFDVEGYGVYRSLMPEMIRLMSANDTRMSVQLVAIHPKSESPIYATASATTYGLTQIARGKNCKDAGLRFKADEPRLTIVNSTYVSVAGDCGVEKPSNGAQATAKDLLGGVDVR